jgi:proteasome lid subunit RPN8/RPN11
MKLTITRAQLADIEQQARRALPVEACGLIVGRLVSGDAVVTALQASENLALDGTDSFEIDPALHIRLQRDLRASGEAIIGVYHSHPRGAPVPSEQDTRAAAYAGWHWLITAWADDEPVARAFVHNPDSETGFDPVELVVRG